MTGEPVRRGVTRGYVGALIVAALIFAVAITVAGWGALAMLLEHGPIQTEGITLGAAVLLVIIALFPLAWGLWQQALVLLRGRRHLAWGPVVALAGIAYLVWSLGGMLMGFSIDETWVSPFAAVLAAAFGLAVVVFWAVLARRVYTDKPVPQWPWEKRGEPGPDWAFPENGNPWADPEHGSGGMQEGGESGADPEDGAAR